MIPIRPATDADDDAIWAMLAPVFRAGETYTVPRDISRPEALRFWTSGKSVFLCGEQEPLGTYYLKPNQGGGGDHVCNAGFVTAPAATGRGVARAMLKHALSEARGRGYRAMQFNFVVTSNVRAIGLWQNAGFEVVGRLPGAFDHPDQGYVDALVMWKDL